MRGFVWKAVWPGKEFFSILKMYELVWYLQRTGTEQNTLRNGFFKKILLSHQWGLTYKLHIQLLLSDYS